MAKVDPGSTNHRIGNHRMGPAEWGFLFALAFLWSSVFFLIKVALGEMRPFTVVVLRLGIGAVVLHIAVLASGSRMPTSLRNWVVFFVMGALNNLIPFCLIAWGQTQIASGLAAILNATTPLFTVLLPRRVANLHRSTGHPPENGYSTLAAPTLVAERWRPLQAMQNLRITFATVFSKMRSPAEGQSTGDLEESYHVDHRTPQL